MKYTNVILYIDDCVVILKTKPNAVIKIITDTHTHTHTQKDIFSVSLHCTAHPPTESHFCAGVFLAAESPCK